MLHRQALQRCPCSLQHILRSGDEQRSVVIPDPGDQGNGLVRLMAEAPQIFKP
jgi:hypothetical protein